MRAVSPQELSQKRFEADLLHNPLFHPRTMKGISNFMTSPQTTEAILEARGKTYGSFAENSDYACQFLAVIRKAKVARLGNRPELTVSQENALNMICQKMSRILSAPDASYADNWDDIAGYAKLGRDGT